MKKLKTIFIISLTILLSFCPLTFATGDAIFNPADANINTSQDKIFSLGGDVVKVLLTVGSALSVVVLIILGIKYMIGAPEEKSTYKKSMLPYIIGASILFASTTLASILYSVLHQIE